MGNETEPNEATVEAERAEAGEAHAADRPPTNEEESAADRSAEEFEGDSAEVAAHYEEMDDIGAHVKGEGSID
jgi:hypothetical protein